MIYDIWDRIDKAGENKPVKNAYKQVGRTVEIFSQMLASHGLNNWPIYPMVVFTHPNAFMDFSRNDPFSGWASYLDKLEDELSSNRINNNISFTASDSAKIKQIISTHEKGYSAA